MVRVRVWIRYGLGLRLRLWYGLGYVLGYGLLLGYGLGYELGYGLGHGLGWLHFIIVKNMCVSHNNPFADIRRWRDETIEQLIITIIASFIVVFMIFDNLLIP